MLGTVHIHFKFDLIHRSAEYWASCDALFNGWLLLSLRPQLSNNANQNQRVEMTGGIQQAGPYCTATISGWNVVTINANRYGS